MAKPNDPDINLRLPKPPFLLVAAILVVTAFALIPPSMAALSRQTKKENPRIHLFQGMDHNLAPKAQSSSVVFADGRAMRPRVTGTVARGELREDDHFYRGYQVVDGETVYYTGFPEGFEVSDRTMMRGMVKFNTFCYPCHGKDGYGNGPVHIRANWLSQRDPSNNAWVPPSNLHAIDPTTNLPQYGSELYADGKMYNVITHGIRNMAGYGHKIKTEDRWAIVLYIRALQRSQNANLADVPADKVELLGR
ncbi:c-type cytochrome [Mucisphaera sp.]|uniref:c-type cytochrome n=1 Tax=Mucisphaera sp. TaxID=2913024 RepID=UPI003D0C26E8